MHVCFDIFLVVVGGGCGSGDGGLWIYRCFESEEKKTKKKQKQTNKTKQANKPNQTTTPPIKRTQTIQSMSC